MAYSLVQLDLIELSMIDTFSFGLSILALVVIFGKMSFSIVAKEIMTRGLKVGLLNLHKPFFKPMGMLGYAL